MIYRRIQVGDYNLYLDEDFNLLDDMMSAACEEAEIQLYPGRPEGALWVKTNNILKAIKSGLEDIEISSEKGFYDFIVYDIARFYYSKYSIGIMPKTASKLAKANFKFTVREGNCYFYSKRSVRLPDILERAIQESLKSALCIY